jgi:hypothetical protein
MKRSAGVHGGPISYWVFAIPELVWSKGVSVRASGQTLVMRRVPYPAGLEIANRTRHGNCFVCSQAGGDRLRLYSSPIKEGRIMNKAISTLIAAVTAVGALTLSDGAYAQAGGGTNGGSSSGSTASPANQVNQVNGATGGYGTPGTTNSGSGMGAKAPNSGLPSGTNSTLTPGTSAPTSNNTLATPSVKSPAAGQ